MRHSLIPPTFFNMEISVPEVMSYLEDFMCEIVYMYVHSLCSLGEKTSWKLENVVATIYKAISNILFPQIIAFKWDTYLQLFFTLENMLFDHIYH